MRYPVIPAGLFNVNDTPPGVAEYGGTVAVVHTFIVSFSVTPATVPDVINEPSAGGTVDVDEPLTAGTDATVLGGCAGACGVAVVGCDGVATVVTGLVVTSMVRGAIPTDAVAGAAPAARVKFHEHVSSLGTDAGTRQPLPGHPTVRVRVPVMVAFVIAL